MRIGTQAVTLGSLEQERRMDVIANNLANASTPGFKKDETKFGKFLDETTYTKMDQGPVHDTGAPLDIALMGDGYLKVQTSQGQMYSRAGNLTLNSKGNIVTQDGSTVLGKSGPITVKSGNVRIDEKGQIFDGDTSVDTLDLVAFPKDTVLKKMQGGYLKPAGDEKPVAAENVTVRQNALEGANFNLVEEMTRMVDTLRVFEAYQKAFQSADRDLDSQVISKLGTPGS